VSRWLPLLWLLGLLSVQVSWAQPSPSPTAIAPLEARRVQTPFEIILKAEKDRYELAESIKLTYTISGPEQAELSFPEAEKLDLKPFEIRDAASATLTASGGRRSWEYRVKVTAYEQGKLHLPQAVIKARTGPGQALTDLSLPAADLEIERVPAGPKDKPDEVRDAKSLEYAGIPPWLVLVLVLTTLLVLMLLRWLVQWLRRPRRLPATPPLEPFPWALQQLEKLTAERLDRQGQWEPFYDQLTHVLRFYLGWRFEHSLLELTTSEILNTLSLPDQHFRPAKDLLETADMVKFAKSYPQLEKSEQHLAWARQLVEENAPPEPAAAKGAGA